MKLDKLTTKAKEALQQAHALAESRGHQELTPEHLLSALLTQEQGVVPALLRKVGVEPGLVQAKVDAALDAQPQVRGAAADLYVGRRLKTLLEDATTQSK